MAPKGVTLSPMLRKPVGRGAQNHAFPGPRALRLGGSGVEGRWKEVNLPPARGCRLSCLTPPFPASPVRFPAFAGGAGTQPPATETADLGGCASQDFAAQSHAPRLCLHAAACRARRGPWNLPEAPPGTRWLPPAFARIHLVPHHHGSRGQMAHSEGFTLR